MLLVQRTHRSPDMTWFTNERIGWIAALILVAGMGYGVGEGQHNQEFVNAKVAPVVAHDKQLQAKVIPALKSQLGCQTARANQATLAAIRADVDPSTIQNCPPVKITVPPPPPTP